MNTGFLVATVGLPASGKTTYVNSILGGAKDMGFLDQYVRAGRDHIRRMLHNTRTYEPWQEDQVNKVQNFIINDGLRNGKIVLVDDMNLRMSYRKKLASMATQHGAGYLQIDFTSVTLDTLIERDNARPEIDRVGEKFIRDNWKRFIQPLGGKSAAYPPQDLVGGTYLEVKPYERVPGLPEAIIVDIDGTTAQIPEGGRSPYDYSRVKEDVPRMGVISLLWTLVYDSKNSPEVIFVSGRPESCREDTEEWLFEHVKIPFKLYMRGAKDSRKDYVVKHEIFDDYIRDRYNIRFVLDDRDQVVRMWRDLGLDCFQVNYGDF